MSPTEESRIFHEGIALFNDLEWFDAHETWEDIWHMATGEKRRFYQGLINAAVTLVHASYGHPRGVRNVIADCRERLTPLPDVYMGVPVQQLLRELSAVMQPILNLPPSMFDPAKGRGLDIPFDVKRVPKIVLQYDPFKTQQNDAKP